MKHVDVMSENKHFAIAGIGQEGLEMDEETRKLGSACAEEQRHEGTHPFLSISLTILTSLSSFSSSSSPSPTFLSLPIRRIRHHYTASVTSAKALVRVSRVTFSSPTRQLVLL